MALLTNMRSCGVQGGWVGKEGKREGGWVGKEGKREGAVNLSGDGFDFGDSFRHPGLESRDPSD